jgi:hypothetical protein
MPGCHGKGTTETKWPGLTHSCDFRVSSKMWDDVSFFLTANDAVTIMGAQQTGPRN